MRGVLCGWWVAVSLGAQAPVKSTDDLRRFFQENCSHCHGADGSGRDAEGRRLAGLDFTESSKIKHARAADRVGDGTVNREVRSMARTVRKGIFFGKVMPAWKDQLSEAEADRMLREVVMKAEKGKVIASEAPSGAASRE